MTWKRLLKAAIVGEVVVVVGSYRVWHQMNTERGMIVSRLYQTSQMGLITLKKSLMWVLFKS